MDDITINGYTIDGGWLVGYTVVAGLLFVVFVVAYTNVISRAGYSRWWILILFVPIVNLIMLLMFCFKEWPVTREVRELRAQLAAASRGYGSAPYGGPPLGNPYAGPPPAAGGYPASPGSYPGSPGSNPPVSGGEGFPPG